MEIIEYKYIRIILALIGLVLSPVILFMAIHGLILGYAGIMDFSPLLIGMGGATVFGLIGFAGACYRLSRNLVSMSKKQKMVSRALLVSGIASGIYLIIGCLYSGMPLSITLLCVVVTVGGGVFLYATPKGS